MLVCPYVCHMAVHGQHGLHGLHGHDGHDGLHGLNVLHRLQNLLKSQPQGFGDLIIWIVDAFVVPHDLKWHVFEKCS